MLKQLVAFIGADGFRDGMRDYFRTHAWGNTTLERVPCGAGARFGTGAGRAGPRLWLESAGVNTIAPQWEVAEGHGQLLHDPANRHRRAPDAASAPHRDCRVRPIGRRTAIARCSARRCRRGIDGDRRTVGRRRRRRQSSRTTMITRSPRLRWTSAHWRLCGTSWTGSRTGSSDCCSGTRCGTWCATNSFQRPNTRRWRRTSWRRSVRWRSRRRWPTTRCRR